MNQFELECYECGNRWTKETHKSLEEFMSKWNNRERMCPVCKHLGIPIELRQEMKENISKKLEHSKLPLPKFEQGDWVSDTGRIGAVIDPGTHFSRYEKGKGYIVVVQFFDREPFTHGRPNYEWIPEKHLKLVKKRNQEKHTMKNAELNIIAECYFNLTK